MKIIIYVAVVCGNTNPSSKYSNTKHRNINQEGHSVGDTIKHYSNNNCSAGGTEEATPDTEEQNTDSQPQAITATSDSIVIDWEQVEEYKEFLDNGGTNGRTSAYCTTGINCRNSFTGWGYKDLNAENVANYDNLLPNKEYLFSISTEINSGTWIYITASTLPQEAPTPSATECYGWNATTSTETKQCSNDATKNYGVRTYECVTGTIVARKCNTDIGLRGIRKNENNIYVAVVCGNTNPSSKYSNTKHRNINQEGHSVGDTIKHYSNNNCSAGGTEEATPDTEEQNTDSQPQAITATSDSIVIDWEQVEEYKEFLDNGGTSGRISAYCTTGINCIRGGGSTGWTFKVINAENVGNYDNLLPSKEYLFGIATESGNFIYLTASTLPQEAPTPSATECYGWNATTSTETKQCSNDATKNYGVRTYECVTGTIVAGSNKCNTNIGSRGIRKKEDNNFEAVVCGNTNPSSKYSNTKHRNINQEGHSVGDTIKHYSNNNCSAGGTEEATTTQATTPPATPSATPPATTTSAITATSDSIVIDWEQVEGYAEISRTHSRGWHPLYCSTGTNCPKGTSTSLARWLLIGSSSNNPDSSRNQHITTQGGLSPNTEYEFRMRRSMQTGGWSDWIYLTASTSSTTTPTVAATPPAAATTPIIFM